MRYGFESHDKFVLVITPRFSLNVLSFLFFFYDLFVFVIVLFVSVDFCVLLIYLLLTMLGFGFEFGVILFSLLIGRSCSKLTFTTVTKL